MDVDNLAASCADENNSEPGTSQQPESVNSVIRLQRNQAEKQRRDRLNSYISELAALVPMVKDSAKPLDKVSILRLAAAHMRLNFSCLSTKHFQSKVPTLPPSIASCIQLIEKNIGGFVIVTTFSGLVIFCSKHIEDFIGYHDIDFMGQSVYNYVHKNEATFFERKVNSVVSRHRKGNLKKNSKVIKLHLRQRPLPRTNAVKYRKMLFKVCIHSNEPLESQANESKVLAKSNRKIKSKDFGTSAVVLMFIEPAKIKPNIAANYLLTHQDIYFTIHGLQGEIMYADHRISTITGYMPRDVLKTSAYSYILESDVPIAMFAQKTMFLSNDGTGLITYRLKIFDSTYIYLQSRGQTAYKDSSTEISHFVCYNRWLSDEEGSQELKKFQERFVPQISAEESSKKTKKQKLNSEQQFEETVLNGESTPNALAPATQKSARVEIPSPSKVKHLSSKNGHSTISQKSVSEHNPKVTRSTKKYVNDKELVNCEDNCIMNHSSMSLPVSKDFSTSHDGRIVDKVSENNQMDYSIKKSQNGSLSYHCNSLPHDMVSYEWSLKEKKSEIDESYKGHQLFESTSSVNFEKNVVNFDFNEEPAISHCNQNFNLTSQIVPHSNLPNTFLSEIPDTEACHSEFSGKKSFGVDTSFMTLYDSKNSTCVSDKNASHINVSCDYSSFLRTEISTPNLLSLQKLSGDQNSKVEKFCSRNYYCSEEKGVLKNNFAHLNQLAFSNMPVASNGFYNQFHVNHGNESDVPYNKVDYYDNLCYQDKTKRSTFHHQSFAAIEPYANGSNHFTSSYFDSMTADNNHRISKCNHDMYELTLDNPRDCLSGFNGVEPSINPCGDMSLTEVYTNTLKRRKTKELNTFPHKDKNRYQQLPTNFSGGDEDLDIVSKFSENCVGDIQNYVDPSAIQIPTQQNALGVNIDDEFFNEIGSLLNELPLSNCE